MSDASVVSLVQTLLDNAVSKGASDIHFEPYQHSYRVRLRMDGILHPVTLPTREMTNQLSAQISARLKVMAKLDSTERRLPQDGRFIFTHSASQNRDCRINTCPTLFGEKIVIRLLDTNKKSLNFDQLGMDAAQKEHFQRSIQKPQGMLLITGPTGSGKTVSLYTALNALNNPNKNISTVEEPIEIHLDGINQIDINAKIGLDYATALRALLRQDPDVIMIGEIRDTETAKIAIQAAQTGHLVLASLHTNSASESLSRLANLGITAFNIASSVTLIIAQRLARKLCPHCKTAEHTPVGCEHCTQGYYGRTGIFEVLPLTATLRTMLCEGRHLAEIQNQARQEGFRSLQESAADKVRQGLTSIAEVNRII
jgi:type IV pilus assembly protein PilB